VFDACFVWKLAPLANERNDFFHRKSISATDAVEHVIQVANSYLALCFQEVSLNLSVS
jgi:hypothetical protein